MNLSTTARTISTTGDAEDAEEKILLAGAPSQQV
jgi:hypothetical protein